MRLKVSENRRYLAYEDGAPFFYLGDTAWELFHRLTREEADLYLRDRAAKRFTVIQAVVLAELEGSSVPNAYGEIPLHEKDPARPNEAYFQHVDWIVDRAASLGLWIGMLPTWGDKWNKAWGAGPEFFNPDNARAYGAWLASRYADAPILWILGGDRPVESDAHRETIRAMADGLKANDGGSRLVTFHPTGLQGSAQSFHAESWLDFNMNQSGHARNSPNYRMIESDYGRSPVKPTIDAEPGYEDHPSAFDLENGYLDDYDCRKAAYWALFAGACGHTYGCHPIWQFFRSDRIPFSAARRPWLDALHLPGSDQMRHARSLLLSRPYFTRIPDPSLLASDAESGTHYVAATRDEAGTYALIYVPGGKKVEIRTDSLKGGSLLAHWFDPRTGTAQRIGEFPRAGTLAFDPPYGGPDWVLALEDAEAGYPAPGSAPLPQKEPS